MHKTKDINRGDQRGRMGLGAAFQFVGIIAQQVLRFAATWLIAHFLGKAILGIYSLANTFWSAVGQSASGGLVCAVSRYLPHHLARDEHAEARGVVEFGLYCAWVAGGLVGLAFYLLADFVASAILKRPETAPVLRILALATPLAAVIPVICTVARCLGSYLYIVYQFMLLPLLFVLFIIPVYLLHGDVRGLTWAFVASYLFPLIALYPYLWRLVRFLHHLAPRVLARPFLAFAGIGALLWLAEFVARNVDLVMVGRIRSAAEAGVYTIATRNATLCSMVMISINAFFAPTASALFSSGRMEEFRAIFRKGTLWILIVGAPVIVYAMAFSRSIMLFFGRGFGEGAWALWLLALAQLFNQGTGLINSALTMANRQHATLVVDLLGVVVTFGLCTLLIPVYGLNGAAIAMAGSVVFVNLTLCGVGYLTLGLSPLSGPCVKPLLAAAAAGILSQSVIRRLPLAAMQQTAVSVPAKDALLVLLAGLVLFAPVYVLAMWGLGAKEEGLTALRAVRSGLKRRGQAASVDDEVDPTL